MKKKEIRICKICGKLCGTKNHEFVHDMCRKHYEQFKKYGRCLDNNPRTVWDDNEIRTYKNYGEIDTYTNTGEVLNTFKFDLEDIKYLAGHKWRSVFKGKQKSPYLVTGHTIYFHRLIMGNPNTEIDHINRDSTDNRKENLRESFRTQQLGNTKIRINNVSGIKGVYYLQRDNKYRAEIAIYNKHFYSKSFDTKAEAAYMRYLYEQYFYKNIGINNSQLMISLINSLSNEQKEHIQKYFINRMKVRVNKI